MSKIDTTGWREFKLSDLFDICLSHTDWQKNNFEEGDIPLVSSGKTNNGIVSFVKKNSYAEMFPGGSITIDMFGQPFFQKENFYAVSHGRINILKPKLQINEEALLCITSILMTTLNGKYDYSRMCTSQKLMDETILLPVKEEYEPDWEYMENYMKTVMEEAEEYIRIVGGFSSNLKYIDASGWGEFRLSDLFTKKTMKGYPKKAESYEEVENGYHIYGQNIGWQYPYKVLMDEQYLHIVEPDKPILAYASSVGEIGLINESFYRSGDNGAFQGLFPIGYHPNLLQMQFVLSILKKEFEAFRYDTSMQNTMDIVFKLPIISTGEPDWKYMEDYMRSIMKKSENIIESLYNL